MITLTTEQAQQIEEALLAYEDISIAQWDSALATIRAARAQENELFGNSEQLKQAEQDTVKREHITDGSPCWCNPELNYKDPETGAEVWVHKEPQ